MPKVFTDLEYTLCIYITGNVIDPSEVQWTPSSMPHAYQTCGGGSPTFVFFKIALSLIPYYLRLMQSLRSYYDTRKTKHLFNGLKYALSITVGALATAKQKFPDTHYIIYVWFYVSVITTLYSLYWDVFMDWGLGDLKAEHFFLRRSENLAYPPAAYYCAIVIDSVFRLGWAIYISPGNIVLQNHFILLLGCVELLRRFVWSIFRVEWEHFQLISEEAIRQRREQRLHQLHSRQSYHAHSAESFFDRHDSDPEIQDQGQLPHQSSNLSDMDAFDNSEVYVELHIPEDPIDQYLIEEEPYQAQDRAGGVRRDSSFDEDGEAQIMLANNKRLSIRNAKY